MFNGSQVLRAKGVERESRDYKKKISGRMTFRRKDRAKSGESLRGRRAEGREEIKL